MEEEGSTCIGGGDGSMLLMGSVIFSSLCLLIWKERSITIDIWGYVLIVIDTGCAMTPLPFSLIDTLIDMVYEVLRLPF